MFPRFFRLCLNASRFWCCIICRVNSVAEEDMLESLLERFVLDGVDDRIDATIDEDHGHDGVVEVRVGGDVDAQIEEKPIHLVHHPTEDEHKRNKCHGLEDVWSGTSHALVPCVLNPGVTCMPKSFVQHQCHPRITKDEDAQWEEILYDHGPHTNYLWYHLVRPVVQIARMIGSDISKWDHETQFQWWSKNPNCGQDEDA